MVIFTDFSKRIRSEQSFTLVELLIVSVLIIILSALMLVNFNSNQGAVSLQNAAQKVALDISRAESMALSSSTQGGTPPAGYGIHFSLNTPSANPPYSGNDAKSYAIFCDNGTNYANSNGLYSSNACASQTLIESLPANVSVTALSTTLNNGLDVSYFPPIPALLVNGNAFSSIAAGYVTITLGSAVNPAIHKTIYIYSTGQVSVQ
jgi:type II secretory pathway pseudopilin PulG